MSSYTEIYLFEHFEESYRRKENEKFYAVCNEIQQLHNLDYEAYPDFIAHRGHFNKIDDHVYQGSFNYLNLSKFYEMIVKFKWRRPNEVILIMKSESDPHLKWNILNISKIDSILNGEK